MELYLITAVCILIIIIVCLTVKIILMRRSIDGMTSEYRRIIREDTNALIKVTTGDRHIRKLASELNKELKELRRMEIRYIRGNDELQDAIVNISHDLRTPLTAISGYLDLLEQEEKSPDAEKYLAIVRERVESLKALTEELFRYSVVTSTDDDYSPEELVLNSELETSLAGFYGAFTEKGIAPQVTIPEEKVIRTLDRRSVQRIFSNILSNALKYSEGDLSVELKTSGEIIFSNSAVMLDATDVGKLFDRFYTVEDARRSTGLGLSIAKILVEKNNGKIGAELSDGRLTIRIRL